MSSSDSPPPGEAAPELLDGRLWVDGCFDFFHHGHAGAIVQARQLGDELYIGVHSDEAILENKGPTVMNLRERLIAVDACRWVTQSVPNAPYVTQLDWVSHFGCRYVVHGDDITSDSAGEDCYRFVKAANRFKVVKRTPSISTTDLVGRMLLCTKTHFIRSLEATLAGRAGPGTDAERRATGAAMAERMRLYATDATAKQPGVDVWFWRAGEAAAATAPAAGEGADALAELIKGKGPQIGQRVVYVDGGFDLFSSGHIAFLQQVLAAEEARARRDGWYAPEAVAERRGKAAGDYPPAFVVAGVHDDEVINEWKGVNYPIMNIYERGLCVLQCKYINAIVFGAPFSPTRAYLAALPWGIPDAVYHGPTAFMPLTYDPYAAPKAMGIYEQIGAHAFADVNAGTIVERILASRDRYEARQRAKGAKADVEAAHKRREHMEEEQRQREASRQEG